MVRFKFWKAVLYGRDGKMEIVKVDSQGRFYLPKSVREAAGIKEEAILEVAASKGQIVLRVREGSVAKKGKGVFKIQKHVEDVDKEIRKRSLQKVLGEIDEIRRR